jgi:hypothetical protein
VAEQLGTGQTGRSMLDQAAADDSITQARILAVDPVPVVPEPGGATLEPALETSAEPQAAVHEVGVNRRLDPEVQAVDGRSVAPAPLAGARRRLSPRPVPVSRRRRPPAQETATATDEEPTPAEEMDDVGTHDEKADAEKAVTPPADATDKDQAAGRGTTATATKPARPKTAAEIVAEQRAREKAAAESAPPTAEKDAGGKDPAETAVTKPVSRVPAASAGASGAAKTARTGASGNKAASSGKGKQALSSVGSGVRRLRNLIASLIWLAAVIAAAVLALGALFTALDQTNQSNEIVRWVLERGHDLVGPLKDLFRLETAKNTLLVNWGIAALVYLIAGKIIERFVRP